MRTRGVLQIDPGELEAARGKGELQLVVAYTDWELADAVLRRAVALAAGLNVRVRLLAIHTVPYAAPYGCPAAQHAHLVGRLMELASQCPFPVEPEVIMAHGWLEGFEYAVGRESTVLVGTRKHFWRTREESLARDLDRDGYHVALIPVE
jgi:hypothetical protein